MYTRAFLTRFAYFSTQGDPIITKTKKRFLYRMENCPSLWKKKGSKTDVVPNFFYFIRTIWIFMSVKTGRNFFF